jgi:predicted membrane metal-binding protein
MREAPERRVANPSRRAPALPVVLAVSVGIIADWSWSWPFSISLLLAAFFALAWAIAFLFARNKAATARLAAISLLIACGCLGAAWHQFQWSLVSTHDLLAFAADEPRPVRLLAVVASDPVLVHPEPTSFPTAIPKRLRTLCNVRAVALMDRHGETPVSGLARLDIVGDMETLLPGTRVDILGTLSLPSVSRNPGGFDFRLFLRERGIRTIVRCDFPDCVRTVEPASGGFWRLFQSWQKSAADGLRRLLSEANSPIAIALLLGPRTDIPQELKEAFLHSGTVHLLADEPFYFPDWCSLC